MCIVWRLFFFIYLLSPTCATSLLDQDARPENASSARRAAKNSRNKIVPCEDVQCRTSVRVHYNIQLNTHTQWEERKDTHRHTHTSGHVHAHMRVRASVCLRCARVDYVM